MIFSSFRPPSDHARKRGLCPMCGIFFHISRSGFCNLRNEDLRRLYNRGPDSIETHQVTLNNFPEPYHLTFISSVLALRGDRVSKQPRVDPATGSVFCWNGEAWSISGESISGNDTEAVFSLLLCAAATASHNASSSDNSVTRNTITDVLANIAGPWAFVFYDAISSTIYFGRDRLGRRSLVIDENFTSNGDLTISSIKPLTDSDLVREVSTNSIHFLSLSKSTLEVQSFNDELSSAKINRSLPPNDIPTLPSTEAVTGLQKELLDALQKRVKDIPTHTPTSSTDDPSRVAILFSGGLDCTLLARLTHEVLPLDQPIDLLNVAFENPRIGKTLISQRGANGTPTNSYETCPDRVTGRSSFAELCQVCPNRIWRLVSINIPYTEMLSHRSTIIQLMRPHNTEMDLSITMALYFAARGTGIAEASSTPNQEPENYTTTVRVLLSGLGADELFGGYSRHAAAFSRGNYEALINELELDFERIGNRNLGRDDRAISHWGRETRYPFLDEDFVKFTLQLPVWDKCGFRPEKPMPQHRDDSARVIAERMEELDPAKMLLRCVVWNLGMQGVASEKKRAIQFGARTAKMHGGKSKGTDLVTEDLNGKEEPLRMRA